MCAYNECAANQPMIYDLYTYVYHEFYVSYEDIPISRDIT